jgi:hypothetical protein
MPKRASVAAATALLMVAGSWCTAHAQQPMSAGQAASPAGWEANIGPYLWLPTARLNLRYKLPALGARLPTSVSSGPGDYLTHLNIAVALSADVRKGPFSLLTDFMYTRFSVPSSNVNIKSIDFLGQPSLPIARSLETSTSTTLRTGIWTLAGGHTLLQRDWGNVDVFAGFRLVWVDARTNYSLALTITGPRANGATFGGIGSASGSQNIWNGVGGLRGRIRLGDTRLFIPYYFDIGGGGSQLTWQISSGLGYQAKWGAVSAVYRYLSLQQHGGAVVNRMTLGGPLLMASFRF